MCEIQLNLEYPSISSGLCKAVAGKGEVCISKERAQSPWPPIISLVSTKIDYSSILVQWSTLKWT